MKIEKLALVNNVKGTTKHYPRGFNSILNSPREVGSNPIFSTKTSSGETGEVFSFKFA